MKTVKIVTSLSIVLLILLIFNSCSSDSSCTKYIGTWVHQDEGSDITSTFEIKENGDKFSITVNNSSKDSKHTFSSSKTISGVCQYNVLQLSEKIPLYEIESFTYNEKSDYLVTNRNIIFYKKK